MTAWAATFMRSSARRSFGFANAYFAENLLGVGISLVVRGLGVGVLMKTSTVNADDYPGIWK
jgi:hypothetical protein